jgi:hypothetical protein
MSRDRGTPEKKGKKRRKEIIVETNAMVKAEFAL